MGDFGQQLMAVGIPAITAQTLESAFTGLVSSMTVGEGDAEDTTIKWDGNAVDFYMGLEDATDQLIIGLGGTVGTNPAITIKGDGTEDVIINAGRLAVGTTVTTGAGAGDIVIPNNVGEIRSVDNAGSNTFGMLRGTSGDHVVVGHTSGALGLAGSATFTGAAAGDAVLANDKALRFVKNAGTSAANYGVCSAADDALHLIVPSPNGAFRFHFNNNSTSLFRVKAENSGVGLLFEAESSSDHSAPAANHAVLYTKDNGSGKTQLAVRFATGAVQVLATEP